MYVECLFLSLSPSLNLSLTPHLTVSPTLKRWLCLCLCSCLCLWLGPCATSANVYCYASTHVYKYNHGTCTCERSCVCCVYLRSCFHVCCTCARVVRVYICTCFHVFIPAVLLPKQHANVVMTNDCGMVPGNQMRIDRPRSMSQPAFKKSALPLSLPKWHLSELASHLSGVDVGGLEVRERIEGLSQTSSSRLPPHAPPFGESALSRGEREMPRT